MNLFQSITSALDNTLASDPTAGINTYDFIFIFSCLLKTLNNYLYSKGFIFFRFSLDFHYIALLKSFLI